MNSYRATLRIVSGSGRHRYHMEDVEAPDLITALRRLIDALPADAADADLVELRRQADADRREYTPE